MSLEVQLTDNMRLLTTQESLDARSMATMRTAQNTPRAYIAHIYIFAFVFLYMLCLLLYTLFPYNLYKYIAYIFCGDHLNKVAGHSWRGRGLFLTSMSWMQWPKVFKSHVASIPSGTSASQGST